MKRLLMFAGLSFAGFGALFFLCVCVLCVISLSVRPVVHRVPLEPIKPLPAALSADEPMVPDSSPAITMTPDGPKPGSQPSSQPGSQPGSQPAPQTPFRELQMPLQKGDVHVKGYVKKDGTVVAPYVRRTPH